MTKAASRRASRGEEDAPLVSVLMPAYNHGPFVEEAVRSVWAQTHPRVELIAVDDASKDDTHGRLVALAEESPIPMRVYRNEANAGICRTLNRALADAKGEWIAILASDDFFAPEKTARQLARAKELGEGYGCIHCDSHMVDPDGGRHGTIYGTSTLPPMQDDAFLSLARGTANMVAITTMARTEVVRAIGGFDESLRAEDFDFHLRLSQATRYGFVDEPLAYSRMLPGSLGRSPQLYLDEMFAILEGQREALGEDYEPVVRRRALHGVNMSMVHGYWPGVARAAGRGLAHCRTPAEAARFASQIGLTSAALGGRRVLAPVIPGGLRRKASRLYQRWIYGA